MDQQVLLVASSKADTNLTAWDVRTGTALTTYKTNASAANGITLLGSDYLITSQHIKPALHVWTWHKDQVHQRSFPPEAITALACTKDGAYLAGGGVSGAVHIWETTSGRLLRSWPCHYKKVTSLAFTDGGRELVTGGEDTLVTAWLLAEVLDSAAPLPQLGGATLAPLHSWSDHTLPVTAVAVGAGVNAPLVFSASIDRTLKIRVLGSGAVLRSVVLPSPLTAIALDPGEHAVYVASAHGTIFDVSLIGESGTSSTDAEARDYATLEGHAAAVTCLAMTLDGEHLASGSDDGSVSVWDLRSRQPIRTLVSPAKGPVSGLLVLDRPRFMPAGVGASGAGGKRGPTRHQPLAQLSKYPGNAGQLRPWEGGLVVLDGSAMETEEGGWRAEEGEGERGDGLAPAQVVGAEEGEVAAEMAALREENARLKEQAERALALAQEWGARKQEQLLG